MKSTVRKNSSKKQQCDEIFIMLINDLSSCSVQDLHDIAEDAEVSYMTLWNWVHGTTLNPHLNTIRRVADAMDYEIFMMPRQQLKKKPILRAVK